MKKGISDGSTEPNGRLENTGREASTKSKKYSVNQENPIANGIWSAWNPGELNLMALPRHALFQFYVIMET